MLSNQKKKEIFWLTFKSDGEGTKNLMIVGLVYLTFA